MLLKQLYLQLGKHWDCLALSLSASKRVKTCELASLTLPWSSGFSVTQKFIQLSLTQNRLRPIKSSSISKPFKTLKT